MITDRSGEMEYLVFHNRKQTKKQHKNYNKNKYFSVLFLSSSYDSSD